MIAAHSVQSSGSSPSIIAHLKFGTPAISRSVLNLPRLWHFEQMTSWSTLTTVLPRRRESQGCKIHDVESSDWKALAAIATIGGGIVALHGIRSKKWTEAHTFFTVLGIVAALATFS